MMIAMHRTKLLIFFISVLINIPFGAYSQKSNKSDTLQTFTLAQCIDFAFQHQPALNQSLINLNIARITNRINLSGWLPQVNLSGNLLPVSYTHLRSPRDRTRSRMPSSA